MATVEAPRSPGASRRFRQVADALAITLEGSPGGAALAAVCNGELVVDLWAGEADPSSTHAGTKTRSLSSSRERRVS
jgi:hypothetical protein